MGPKKQPDKASKKTEQKKKEKVIEDKTFGLKNKKGGKNQKYIAQVQKQVQQGGDPKARRMEEMKKEEKKRKEEERKKAEEDKKLFRPVVVDKQQVESGVDPKSIFCAFYKQGLCKKGGKCKFSHDPAVERKAAKRDLYTDARDGEKEEGMEDWDEEQLNEVIKKKHGQEKANQTDIICKYFLDAVENNKYGWFWQCPNGGNNCMYRHALPPGFVLKKDKKREEKTEEISLEELIEEKRAQLSSRTDLTKVTLETFVQWKKRKLKEKADAIKKEKEGKKAKMKAGLAVGLSGREMFTFDPKMAGSAEGDDDDEGGEFEFEREQDEDDGVKVHEIKFDEFGIMDDGVDESTASQLAKLKAANDVDGAVGGVDAGAIDEELFEDEDLDELEEDMNDLDV